MEHESVVRPISTQATPEPGLEEDRLPKAASTLRVYQKRNEIFIKWLQAEHPEFCEGQQHVDLLHTFDSPKTFVAISTAFLKAIGEVSSPHVLRGHVSALNDVLKHATQIHDWQPGYTVGTEAVKCIVEKAKRRKMEVVKDVGDLRPRRMLLDNECRINACFLRKGGPGIQHRAAFAWSFHAINRGDEWRSRLRLEHFGICSAKADTSPDEMEIFSFCFDKSKTNTSGAIETIGAARHMIALVCPVSAFFFALLWRFTDGLGGEAFPITLDLIRGLGDLDYDFPWYGQPIYVNKYGKEMGYEGQRKFFQKVMLEAGVSKKDLQNKVTHLRTLGARQLEDHQATSRYDVQVAGRWNPNRMDRHYLNDISINNALAGSGAKDKNSYSIPRSRVTAPPELCKLIWPTLDDAYDAYDALPIRTRDKDTSLAFFLEALQRGREIILQDAAIVQDQVPDCALWQHDVFKHPMWAEFKEKVLAAEKGGDDMKPVGTIEDLQQLAGIVQGSLARLHNKVDSCIASLKSHPTLTCENAHMYDTLINVDQPPRSDEPVPLLTLDAPPSGMNAFQVSSSRKQLPNLPSGFAAFDSPVDLWEAYSLGSATYYSFKEAEELTNTSWRASSCRRAQKRNQQTWYKIKKFAEVVETHPEGATRCLGKLKRILQNEPRWRMGTLLGKIPNESWLNDVLFGMS